MTLTQERLKELLDYNPETGAFTRRMSRRGAAAGSVAGSVHNRGYVQITVDGANHLAHRLAWLYVYGVWPTQDTDHINRVRNDNRIANLRDVSHRENMLNTGVRSDNTSGVIGVCWVAARGKWHSCIGVFGRTRHLGRFADFNDAVAARRAAEVEVYGSQGGA